PSPWSPSRARRSPLRCVFWLSAGDGACPSLGIWSARTTLRSEKGMFANLLGIAFILLELVFLARALLRPHREPASRLAWVVVILLLPIFGMVVYLLFGETNVGRRRIARMHGAIDALRPSKRDRVVAEERVP